MEEAPPSLRQEGAIPESQTGLTISFNPTKRSRLEERSSNECVIEKPQEDYREYRPLELDNGLRAIVVSDSQCDKSAAALTVNVGSLFDPAEIQGLAHFLEHMLFLGTEKYPKEEEYKEFLAQHAGASNAFTAETHTNYHFSVSPAHLDDALDRFSQFFIAPLFNESSTDRELNNVHSEHSKNEQSDSWRFHQLTRNEANPKHPLNHFGTGNLKTLKEIPERDGYPVRRRLLEFYEKYYSANLMCLVVLGKESLDDLAAMVQKHFSSIVNRNVTVPVGPQIGHGEPAFDHSSWPRYLRVVPVKDIRTATFEFLLPQEYPMYWRTRPSSYLGFVLGHEGKGSLLSCLKALGLVTDLSAGLSFDDAGASLFDVTVHLTEAGESQVCKIGECLFAYIGLLQQCPVSEELWRETQCVKEMNFRFQSVSLPLRIVTSLADSLQDNLPIDKVLSGPAKLWDFDKEGIASAAGMMTCSRLYLVLAMKSLATETETMESERWYGTKYKAGPLPDDWHQAWACCRVGDGSGPQAAQKVAAALGLALPLPNPFVAEDFELKPKPENGIGEYPVRRDVRSAGVDSSLLHFYFRQDSKFNLPKAFVTANFYSPWVSQSAEHRVKTLVWATAVSEELNEFSYDAEVAGLRYSLTPMSRGLSVSVAGYHDKLFVLLRALTEKMLAVRDISEHTWNIVHTVMLRTLKNAAEKQSPMRQAYEWQQRALWRHAMTSAERLETFLSLTRESLQDISCRIFERCFGEALLQGNATAPSDAAEALKPLLQSSAALESGTLPLLHGGRLPGGPRSCVVIRRRGTNPEEKNGAVVVALQAAVESLDNVLMCQLASQVLKPRCFDELRTKQNLGYIVDLACIADNLGEEGTCGLQVVVQSELHPTEVHRRVRPWLAAALEQLQQDDDNDLNKYVKALLVKHQERPKNMGAEFSRNWSEVSGRSFRFTRKEESIAFLQRDPDELLRMFRAFVRDSLVPAPRIAAEIIGSLADDTPPAATAEEDVHYEREVQVLESLEAVEAFRQTLQWTSSPSTIAT